MMMMSQRVKAGVKSNDNEQLGYLYNSTINAIDIPLARIYDNMYHMLYSSAVFQI